MAPLYDQHFGLIEAVEDLALEQIVTKLPVEALVVAVLQGAPRFHGEGLHADPGQLLADRFGGEHRAVAHLEGYSVEAMTGRGAHQELKRAVIVGADMIGRARSDKEMRQQVQDIVRSQSSGEFGGQAYPGELVDHRRHAEGPTVVGPGLDEVVGPDMVLPARPQSDAGSVIEPEPAALGLFGWNLKPLPSPDAFNSLVVHVPAFGSQQCRDAAIAIAAIEARQADDRSCQGCLVGSRDDLVSL